MGPSSVLLFNFIIFYLFYFCWTFLSAAWCTPTLKKEGMDFRQSRYSAKFCLNCRTATPPQASRPSGLGANVPSSSSRPFKPTPVDFDFVIGNSSVKRGPRQRPKPEKEKRSASRRPKAEAQKTSKDAKSSAPKRKSQSTSAPKVPKDRPGRDEPEGYPTQASTPTETPSPDKNPSGSISVLVQGSAARQDITVQDGRSLDGDNEGDGPYHPDALPPSADVGEEAVLALQIDEDEDPPDSTCEEDGADLPVEGKQRDSRTTSEGGDPFLELVAPIARTDLTMDPVSSGSQPHAAPTEADIQLANDPDHPEQGAPQISPLDAAEPPLSLEQTGDSEGEPDLQEPQGLDATASEGMNASSHVLRPTSTVEIQEDVAEDPTPARSTSPISTPEASPISPSPDCSPEALDADGRTPLRSEPVGSCEFNTALLPTAEAAAAGKKSGPSAPSPPAPSQESASGPEKAVSKAKTPRPRKPPLPYDALRAQVGTKSTVARSNELDYLGLDPSLVERGEIKSYQECFGNFVDVFSWSQCSNDVTQKERYLREALQIFTQLGFFF